MRLVPNSDWHNKRFNISDFNDNNDAYDVNQQITETVLVSSLEPKRLPF